MRKLRVVRAGGSCVGSSSVVRRRNSQESTQRTKSIVLAWQKKKIGQHRQENKTTFKVGVNNKLDIKAFMKKPLYKFENLATLTSGLGVSGIMKNEIGLKYGFQMDINL